MDDTAIARAILNIVRNLLYVIGGFYLGIAFHSWRVQKCIKENEDYEKETKDQD